MDTNTPSPSPARPKSSGVLLIVVWLVVGLPAAWGVSQTVIKSMDLFRSHPAATVAPVAGPATSP